MCMAIHTLHTNPSALSFSPSLCHVHVCTHTHTHTYTHTNPSSFHTLLPSLSFPPHSMHTVKGCQETYMHAYTHTHRHVHTQTHTQTNTHTQSHCFIPNYSLDWVQITRKSRKVTALQTHTTEVCNVVCAPNSSKH